MTAYAGSSLRLSHSCNDDCLTPFEATASLFPSEEWQGKSLERKTRDALNAHTSWYDHTIGYQNMSLLLFAGREYSASHRWCYMLHLLFINDEKPEKGGKHNDEVKLWAIILEPIFGDARTYSASSGIARKYVYTSENTDAWVQGRRGFNGEMYIIIIWDELIRGNDGDLSACSFFRSEIETCC